ncbi:MAG TPA: PilT/PilU family type 4a pilus ATPase [Kofleriaceae bacterium]|nr:PilT/PilU family type 4a pilus ATPase [Kofleriaceae bacterium]
MTNLTARPVSLDQLTNMLRGSPVAALIPEADSTAAPVDVQIGARRVRVQIGRRGDEVLVRLTRPDGVATTMPIQRIAEPAARTPDQAPTSAHAQSSSAARAKSPTASRAKSPTGAGAKSPTGARAKSPTGARAKSPTATRATSPSSSRAKSPTSSRAKSPTSARAKTPTTGRAKRPTAARAKSPTKRPSIDIGMPSPASLVGASKAIPAGASMFSTASSPAPASASTLGPATAPTRDLSPSGLFDALDLDGDIELGAPVGAALGSANAPALGTQRGAARQPASPGHGIPTAIDVDAPTHSSSAGIVIPSIRERVEIDAPTHTSSPSIALPPVSASDATHPVTVPHAQSSAVPKATGELAALVEAARARGASDLHIAAARVTSARIGGQLLPLDGTQPLSAAEVEGLLLPLLDREMRTTLNRVGYVDFALEAPDGGRLRTNLCKQQQGLKGTFRLAMPGPLPLDKLGLPQELAKVVSHHQGLVVIAGPSGHGKTTTLAALVDLVNSTKPHHILTIEDPVEIVHPRKMAVVSQREVGRHTTSFARGLKASLREDPDVIVIGELRDRESVEIALTAAETGHLVLATMSTPSAAKTIDRLIDMFPPEEHSQVRSSIAGALRAIVAQRLLPKKGGGGVVPAVELVTGVLPLAVMIREDKMYQLPNLMQRGRAFGMIRLEESIAELVRTGRIEDDSKTQLLWKVK